MITEENDFALRIIRICIIELGKNNNARFQPILSLFLSSDLMMLI